MRVAAIADNPAIIGMSRGHLAAVRAWLVIVAVLVIAMVVVGGATRLTESGLSITEWQPIKGTIPPLSDGEWAAEFEKYKQIPQYVKLNLGMSLEEFKFIYWWEWSHRLLGRLRVGMLGINTGLVSNAAAPFGGVGQSGIGREGGREGIHEYLDTTYALVPTG